MINLLKYIYSKLRLTNRQVYQEKVPKVDPITKTSPVFPYIVFKMPTSNETDKRDDIILEIDIWDNIADTTRLETLTTTIDNSINRSKYIDSNFQVSLYRINRLQIPDPDETIRRRQLRYQCKTYFIN